MGVSVCVCVCVCVCVDWFVRVGACLCVGVYPWVRGCVCGCVGVGVRCGTRKTRRTRGLHPEAQPEATCKSLGTHSTNVQRAPVHLPCAGVPSPAPSPGYLAAPRALTVVVVVVAARSLTPPPQKKTTTTMRVLLGKKGDGGFLRVPNPFFFGGLPQN